MPWPFSKERLLSFLPEGFCLLAFCRQSPHFMPPKGQGARHVAWAAFVLAPLFFGFLALILGQDANWDLRNYHYYNAYAFLNDRYAQDLLPSQTPYFYNPLLDVPFFWLATHVPAKVAGFALGAVQGLNFVLLFMIAHAVLLVSGPRRKVLVCLFLAALGMYGGGSIAQLGTTFWDNVTSLGVFLSAALVIRHEGRFSRISPAKAFALAALFGVPAGMMMGLKLPSVPYAVGLCGGLLAMGGNWKRGFLLSFAFGIGVLVGGAATFGSWAFFLQTHFGSPLFPYFNNVFQSPLAPLASARDIQYVPHSMGEWFSMPFLFARSPFRVGEIDWRDWRLTILYVLLPLAVVARAAFGRTRGDEGVARSKAGAYLLISFSIAYVVWLGMFSIYRYAVPLEMIAPVLIVLAAGLLPFRANVKGFLAAAILVVVAFSVRPGNWTRRDVWLDRFVEVETPPLGDTSNLMILMAGLEPYSHVIPEFPADISFVRVQSNFSSPEQGKGINGLLRERIEAHRSKGGVFKLLIPAWQVAKAQKAVSYFGLKVMPKTCLAVTDRLFEQMPLKLCDVVSR
ncbi:MAG: hypothetical protein PHE27_07270 [Alphaproteobacteria bacterium]|nr:hypothetical protein [Alphaproteobacteria bacterium]